MSNLSTFAEVGIIDARASAGTLIVPKSTDIPGRVITFKDIYGAVGNSTIALVMSTGDTYEDGTIYRTLQNPYDFITLYAASTNMWAIIGGTQVNAFRATTMSNSSNITSSIITNTINTTYAYASYLYPQTGLSNTVISNVVPTANATTSGTSIGLITSNFFQLFTQSTVTNNINAGTSATSTIFAGASITPAYSTFIISTINLGTNTNRWYQTFAVSTITSSITTDLANVLTVSTQNIIGFSLLGTTILSTQQILCSSIQIGAGDSILDVLGPLRTQDLSTLTLEASTITSGTMTLDRLFGGPLLTATTTGNIYPFNAGALVGFGATTASNGFYAEGHFRSTFTQVIQPTLDAGAYSNIILINGNVSTQNIYTSTLSSQIFTTLTTTTSTIATNYISSGNAFISTITVNGFTVGTGVGYVNIPFVQSILLSSIQTNTSLLNSSTINATTISTASFNVSSFSLNFINTNNISAGNFFVSSFVINSISTNLLNVSSFNINVLSAGTLLVSTINFQNISSGTGFISSLNVNSLTFGSGTGYADFTALRAGLVSTIETDAGVLKVSSVNAKLPPFWSTLNIPPSSFSISGTSALTPIVLYSNVQFPPYTKGLFKIYQKTIFVRNTGTTANDSHPSILYTQGLYPSTTTFLDGFSAVPYLNENSVSTFTTLVTMCQISSITTRNISYYDTSSNSYTGSIFLGNLAVEYVPSFGNSGDFGQPLAGVN